MMSTRHICRDFSSYFNFNLIVPATFLHPRDVLEIRQPMSKINGHFKSETTTFFTGYSQAFDRDLTC